MKIALIGQRSIPATYGGVEVYAEELAARLADRGHEVTAFCAEAGRSGSIVHRGVKVQFVPVTNGKHTRALSQSFSSSIRSLGSRFDVVHYMAMGPTIASPLTRFGSRAAVVATIQGRDDQRAKWSPPAQLLMRASLATLRRMPHRVIPVSQELFDEFLPHIGDRLRRVPNGIFSPDPNNTGEEILGSFGLEPRSYVLFASRLVPEKRVEDLISGFMASSVDKRLIIAGVSSGTDDYVAGLHRLAASDPRIEFIGHRTAAEVEALQRHTALFALVSELEGLPFALLEAASRSAPLLVSDLPCNLEVVGQADEGAAIVNIGAVDQITAGIERVVSAPEAHEAAARRSKIVLDTFGWSGIVSEIEAIYEEAIEARSR